MSQLATAHALILAQQREIERLRESQCELCTNVGTLRNGCIFMGDTQLTRDDWLENVAELVTGADEDEDELVVNIDSKWAAALVHKTRARNYIELAQTFAVPTGLPYCLRLQSYVDIPHYHIEICKHTVDGWTKVFLEIPKLIAAKR